MNKLLPSGSRGGIGRRKGLKIREAYTQESSNSGILRVCSKRNIGNDVDIKKSFRHNFGTTEKV